MKSLIKLILAGGVFLSLFSCQTIEETKIETQPTQPTTIKTETPKSVAVSTVDVSVLANKSVEELDKTLGKPLENKQIENGGEYRLYKLASHSKGLAVRFYGGKAKSFNLILENPVPSSKEALKNFFNIDVGKMTARKDAKEPLSEVYQGNFGGVKFSKLSAKREEGGKGFVFVLAEVAN
jgi:hypothetical protein